ncbi:MAG: transcriptional repressor LexA [Firmicutes bacterium]|nr:transcriptional repressor LexA [Bacillota bacterium]
MTESLTGRQRQILEFIKRQTRERGYPPSVREIGEAVGLSSSSTVHGHLARLEEKGYLRRDPSKPRAIEILEEGGRAVQKQRLVSLPLVGRVTAGQPILAVENIEDYVPLPRDLVGSEGCFLLKVQGDSMVGAGIHDGDLVIVKPQPTADNGDIVVALLEDEATVKRFYRERGAVRLQPENPRLEPIVTRNVRIVGKVVGLFRRL